jgi:hypothetical protein
MEDFVDTAELVRTVKEFLRQMTPALEPKMKFDTQVAAYLLDMVARELSNLPARKRAPDAAAVRSLCEQIRGGARDGEWQRTLEEVLTETIRQVKIVRPDHLSPERRSS